MVKNFLWISGRFLSNFVSLFKMNTSYFLLFALTVLHHLYPKKLTFLDFRLLLFKLFFSIFVFLPFVILYLFFFFNTILLYFSLVFWNGECVVFVVFNSTMIPCLKVCYTLYIWNCNCVWHTHSQNFFEFLTHIHTTLSKKYSHRHCCQLVHFFILSNLMIFLTQVVPILQN